MNKLSSLVVAFAISLSAHAQAALDKKAQEVLAEGKQLYRMEVASRQAPGLFLQKYKGKEKPVGNFSYVDKDEVRCVFYGKEPSHAVLGSVIIDTSLNIAQAIVDLTERKLTKRETDLYEIYTAATNAVKTDSFFKKNDNYTNDALPVIANGEKKVYIMSFPKKTGTLTLGNDYLLTFSDNNAISSKKKLHKDLITLASDGKNANGGGGYTMHTHVQAGDGLIQPTDLCTLMLYKTTGKWSQHYVISRNHVCIWDKDKDELSVLTLQEWQDMLKNPDKAAKQQAQH